MKELDDATEIMIGDGQELVLPDEQEAEQDDATEYHCRMCGNTYLEVFNDLEYGKMARCRECGDEFCI